LLHRVAFRIGRRLARRANWIHIPFSPTVHFFEHPAVVADIPDTTGHPVSGFNLVLDLGTLDRGQSAVFADV
jgi:hypothetical protein